MSPTATKPPARKRVEKPLESETPETEAEEPVLRLSTLVPKRPRVQIETLDAAGKPVLHNYEIRVARDFGIEEYHELLHVKGPRFFELYESTEDLTPDEGVRMKELMLEIVDRVLDAPVDVKQSLPDNERAQIATVFFGRYLVARQAMMARISSTTES